jgi:hypothetical protein
MGETCDASYLGKRADGVPAAESGWGAGGGEIPPMDGGKIGSGKVKSPDV